MNQKNTTAYFEDEKQVLKTRMNALEWTKELDTFLMQSVIRNYFNFDTVSAEVNIEQKNLCSNFGATNAYTNEKCRIRWSYLHQQRKIGNTISYQGSSKSVSVLEGENNKENNKENNNRGNILIQKDLERNENNNKKPKKVIQDAAGCLESKDYSSITQKKEAKTMAEIEANMWKNNIKHGERKRQDFLDTTSEDFSKQKSLSIDGHEITPSSFNIFRDSLRDASQKLIEAIHENLPEMNLHEIEDSESEGEKGAEGTDTDEEVLLLDFRTAIIQEDNRVVLQAKPFQFATDFEEIDRRNDAQQPGSRAGQSLDTYLQMVRHEQFKEEDGAIMLDPDINIQEKFNLIDLPCNQENRINNNLNAQIRKDQESVQGEPKKMRFITGSKSYETDKERESGAEEEQKQIGGKVMKNTTQDPAKKTLEEAQKAPRIQNSIDSQKVQSILDNNLDKFLLHLDQITPTQGKEVQIKGQKLRSDDPLSLDCHLAQVGLEDLDELIGHCQESDVDEYEKQLILQQTEANEQKTGNYNVNKLQNIAKVQNEVGHKKGHVKATYGEPDNTEDSDVAPVSPYADAISLKDQKQLAEKEKQIAFMKTVKAMNSASETDEGAVSGSEKTRQMKAVQQSNLNRFQPQNEQQKLIKNHINQQKKNQQSQILSVVPSDTTKQDEQLKKVCDPEASSSSQSSGGSADEEFDRQRQLIRQKLNIQNKTTARPSQQVVAKQIPTKYSSSSDEQLPTAKQIKFDRQIAEERRLQAEMIEKKKAEAIQKANAIENAIREEQHNKKEVEDKKKQAVLDAELERKRKENEELMQKLKRQDEERKKRKKEEKEKKEREVREIKEREAKAYKDLLEAQRMEKEDKKELERSRLREAQEQIEREKFLKEQESHRIEQVEKQFHSEESWIQNGRPNFPCLFDKKCSFMSQLSSFTLELELKIRNNQIKPEDSASRRYKSLVVPLGCHIANDILCELIEYFMLNSTIHTVENNEKSKIKKQNLQRQCFPYKCIAIQLSTTEAPLSKPLLESCQDSAENATTQVLNLLFDTEDEPQISTSISFDEALKQQKLLETLRSKNIRNSPMTQPKMHQSKLRQKFPFGKINDENHEELQIENDKDFEIEKDSANLGQSAIVPEHTSPKEKVPLSMVESWELFRRRPDFYASNLSKQSSIFIQKKNRKQKIIVKDNDYEYQNVCVVLKDISFNPIVECKSKNSLAYLINKACIKGDLDICGLRLVYMDDKNCEEYYQLFFEKFDTAAWQKPVLAIVFRGVDAVQKLENIIGHFNPEVARATENKSLRACFGRSKQENCAFQMANSSKIQLFISFWFGGRIENKQETQHQCHLIQSQTLEKQNTVKMIVPRAIEKGHMLLSPIIPGYKVGQILQRLCAMGVTILDVQKIDYNELDYQNECMDSFLREHSKSIRGERMIQSIGFIIKLARENLSSHIRTQTKNMKKDLDELLEGHEMEDLIAYTEHKDDYKELSNSLKQIDTYCSNYFSKSSDISSRKTKEVDLNELKDIKLTSQSNQTQKLSKSNIKPLKSLVQIDPLVEEEKYTTSASICFIKLSTFKQQAIGDIISVIMDVLDVEILGSRIIDCDNQIYKPSVPANVQNIFKSVAFKFHELSNEDKLINKIANFKSLVLVLRGQNTSGQLEKVYDYNKMKFKSEFLGPNSEVISIKATPHVIFLSQNESKNTLLQFILQSRLLNLYYDLSRDYSHLNNSEYFQDQLQESKRAQNGTCGEITTSKFIQISNIESLLLSKQQDSHSFRESQGDQQQSFAVCVIKPNQPFSVVMRALKQIINNINCEGLSPKHANFVRIGRISILEHYTQAQIDHLFDQDILKDSRIPSRRKSNLQLLHQVIFETFTPVVQFTLEGFNAIPKLKSIIGNTHPGRIEDKHALRGLYGVDRLDNAFYVSETITEALEDKQMLFDDDEDQVDNDQTWEIVNSLENEDQDASDPLKMYLQDKEKLALVLISPTLVINNDFVFILDEFYRAKFRVCAIKKKTLQIQDLQTLFEDLVPRTHSLEILEQEFGRGDTVLIVLEKARAIQELSELIGTFGIKIMSDWEKKKAKKQNGAYQMYMYNNGGQNENSLISEYGSYIFAFPDEELNKKKILSQFKSLPNSKSYQIQKVDS